MHSSGGGCIVHVDAYVRNLKSEEDIQLATEIILTTALSAPYMNRTMGNVNACVHNFAIAFSLMQAGTYLPFDLVRIFLSSGVSFSFS